MRFNSHLTRLELRETNQGMGYKKKVFTETADRYPVDRQPYSGELAFKQYGLADERVRYLCFAWKKGLKTGDYVSDGESNYLVLLAKEWDRHTEIILGKVLKGGS